ncbi:ECF subfamily RNA polymerase sigma-24 factor [Paenibacillus sp. Aloe-11]|nr:ECF subfamily RNA polymerase sigma-24 factor [Paenibacillus sp. Aloe-11]
MLKLSKTNAAFTEQQFSDRLMACKEKLYRFAFSYVKNEQDAIEIVSEASYKAFLSYKKLKDPDYFETWMTRIVINSAIDHIQRKKKYTYIEDCETPFMVKESGITLEEQWDLYEALDYLSPKDKTFIILKFFEGQRFKDMAEVLSISENTVKSRFYRILDKLKRQMTTEEG